VRQPAALHLERLDEIPFLPLYTQRKRRGDTIAISLSTEDITAVVTIVKRRRIQGANPNGVVGQLDLPNLKA